MPRRTYYYLSYSQLQEAKKPADWWLAHSLFPLVLIPRQDTVLYDGATEQGTLEVIARTIGTLCPAGWLAGFWACNNLRRATLMPFEDGQAWQTFTERLGWLAAAVQAHGGAGVVCDSEIYFAAQNQRALSGPMNPKLAWLGSLHLPARAAAYAKAIDPSLLLGCMVASSEFSRFPAMTSFWRQVMKGRPRTNNLLFGEDYARGERPDHGAADVLGARYVPGFADVKTAREHGVAWVYEQGAGFLKGH